MYETDRKRVYLDEGIPRRRQKARGCPTGTTGWHQLLQRCVEIQTIASPWHPDLPFSKIICSPAGSLLLCCALKLLLLRPNLGFLCPSLPFEGSISRLCKRLHTGHRQSRVAGFNFGFTACSSRQGATLPNKRSLCDLEAAA